MDHDSDTAQLLGSSAARRGKRAKWGNRDCASNGHSMTVLSEPEGLPMDDETQEMRQLKRFKGLSGSLGDSLPSVRAQLAANLYAESRELHKRSRKETTPLLADRDEKGGGSNDSNDSSGLSAGYDSVLKHSPTGKRKGLKAAVKKW